MLYDPIWDKRHEECGVFGIFDHTIDIPRHVYWDCLRCSIVARKVPAWLFPTAMASVHSEAWAS